MSPKLICLLLLLTLCVAVLMVEARGGRGRGGSLGSAFYRRSHKKHSSSGGSSSRRKVVSGSPVHTTYTKSMMTGQGVDEKLARHRTRTRLKGHKSHTSLGGSSSHKIHTHVETPPISYNSHTILGKKRQHITHNAWNPFGGHAALHNTPLGNPHITQHWGGHQLPAGHVHVTQPSSMPVNAVYYAQPPRQSSSDDGSLDFAVGYLVGRSLTRSHNQHHHHYQEAQQQQPMNNDQPASTTTVISTSLKQPKSSDQEHYWPTDTEVSLAPLNSTLLPSGMTEKSSEIIFRNPPVLSAQPLTRNNLTFELPTATAPPPVTPPTGGIICMPWTFNETDPEKPENVVVVQKTICFPAPPPPPPPPSTPLAPIAGDIQVDVSMAMTTATTRSSTTSHTTTAAASV